MSNALLLGRAALVWAALAVLPGPRSHAADANWFPDDTELVVVVNLKQIFSSEMIRAQPDAVGELNDVLGQFAGVHAVQKYLKEAGLDAFRDLTRVTFVYTGAKDPRVSFLVLEGEFAADKLNAAARADGAALRAKKSGADTVYEIAPRGEKRFYATLVNPSTLLAAASEEALADARGRTAGARKSGLKKEIRTALEAADDNQSVAFVSGGAAFARRVEGLSLPRAESAVTFLRTLDAFAGGVTLAKDVRFRLTFNAESEEAAKKLTESANGAARILLTLVRQTAGTDAKYLPVVDVVKGLRFTQEGAGIRFAGAMTLDTVEKLLTNFPPRPSPEERK
jgi:hypothetical protein